MTVIKRDSSVNAVEQEACITMKVYVLTLVLVLCQSQSVTCTFFEFMSEKFTEMAVNVANTLKGIRQHVRTFLKNNFQGEVEPPKKVKAKVKRPLRPFWLRTLSNFRIPDSVPTESMTDGNLEFPKIQTKTSGLLFTPQLAMLDGRHIESHIITTGDGYILTCHRLTPSRYSSDNNLTAVLHHGLLGSSADWIIRGPKKSLPYLLSDAGYDVWLVNARGNYYSRSHVWRTVDSLQFWRFSWQEMGQYDLVAIIDYIRKAKALAGQNMDKIDYIGHSMGATAFLVMLSTSPQYNKYFRIGILIAPLAFMSNVEGPLRYFSKSNENSTSSLLQSIGSKEIFPSRRIPNETIFGNCTRTKLFCSNPLFFLSGKIPDTSSWDPSFIVKLLDHVPAGGSVNTILHYAQVMDNGKFHRFDNEKHEFNLSKITTPVAIISSDHDEFASVPDIVRLYFSIPHSVENYVIRDQNFSHTDFLWHHRAHELVFTKIIDLLDKDSKWLTLKTNEV